MTNEYDTYVLRLWPYDDKRQIQKIMLENPHTGSKVRFNNWNDLVLFLQTKRASLGREVLLNVGATRPDDGIGGKL